MSENTNCPLCNNKAQEQPRLKDGTHMICENCGEYFLSGTVITILQDDDVKVYLPNIIEFIDTQHNTFDIKCPEILTDTSYLIVETSVFIDKLEIVLPKTDFTNDTMFDDEHNIEFLSVTLNTILKYDDYDNDDIFKECKTMIDIFCLQELYQIALRLSLNEDGDIDMRAGNYIYIIQEFDIDFNLIVALAGKEFFESDFYDKDEEDNNINIIKYLISNNYDKVIRFLNRDFKSNQELLEFIIKDCNINSTYQDALVNIGSLEDCFDYPEIMRLYSWADSGFDMRGES